jgi:hypothetical protein
MRLFTTTLLLSAPLLAAASCRFEFWQYDNFEYYDNGVRMHAYMVRTDVFGENMDFPKMIDDFCSIHNSKSAYLPDYTTKIESIDDCLLTPLISELGDVGNGVLARECIRDGSTTGHARIDYSPGQAGVRSLHDRYLRIIDALKFAGYGICDFVNHAAY